MVDVGFVHIRLVAVLVLVVCVHIAVQLVVDHVAVLDQVRHVHEGVLVLVQRDLPVCRFVQLLFTVFACSVRRLLLGLLR